MNPITIYMFVNLVNVRDIAARFVSDKNSTLLGEDLYRLILMLVVVLINLLVVRFLFNKKIFIKI